MMHHIVNDYAKNVWCRVWLVPAVFLFLLSSVGNAEELWSDGTWTVQKEAGEQQPLCFTDVWDGQTRFVIAGLFPWQGGQSFNIGLWNESWAYDNHTGTLTLKTKISDLTLAGSKYEGAWIIFGADISQQQILFVLTLLKGNGEILAIDEAGQTLAKFTSTGAKEAIEKWRECLPKR